MEKQGRRALRKAAAVRQAWGIRRIPVRPLSLLGWAGNAMILKKQKFVLCKSRAASQQLARAESRKSGLIINPTRPINGVPVGLCQGCRPAQLRGGSAELL